MNELLLEKLNWRYATKAFNPDKKIADHDWATLEEVLRLTPSSYGLQPWKFIVITNQELKDSLVEASYKQSQVSNCSHLLVVALKTSMTEADVDTFIQSTCEIRQQEPKSLDFYRNMIVGDVVNGPRGQDIQTWAKLQCYIALGNFMTSAAMLDIDCCPMEGFVPAMYDEALGLAVKGLTTAVVCPAGYRADDDKHGKLPKVRFANADLFETID